MSKDAARAGHVTPGPAGLAAGGLEDPDDAATAGDVAGAQLAAALLARIVLAGAERRPFPFGQELDGAGPDGQPVFHGVTLDWVQLAGGGLLLAQRLEQTIAALLHLPVDAVARWAAEDLAAAPDPTGPDPTEPCPKHQDKAQ